MAKTDQHPDKQSPPSTRPAAPVPGDHESHGNSLAAWTCVTLIMVGALVMCIGVAGAWVPVFVAGGVVVVIGLIAGKVMASMGFGVAGKGDQPH